jgi:hypothetical protein
VFKQINRKIISTFFILILIVSIFLISDLKTVKAVDSSFGYATAGSADWNVGGNEEVAGQFTLSEDGTAYAMGYYAKGYFGTTTGSASLGIYNESTLAPNSLLTYTNITVNGIDQWYNELVTNASLTAGTYWLGVATSNNLGIAYDSLSNNLAYKTTGGVLLNPFGTPDGTLDTRRLSIYVNYTVASADSTPPTYLSLSSSSTVAGASCQLNSTWTDETGLASTGGYIIEHNNTGTLTNSSWAAFASNPETNSTTITLNSTVGNVVQWQVYANDTSNNWNSTGLQNITLTDGDLPTFGAISGNTTVAGAGVAYSCTVSDNVAVSGFIASWNNTGVWTNGTWTSGGSGVLTGTHNSSVGATVSVKFYANDSANNWASSGVSNFTLTDGSPPTFGTITGNTTISGAGVAYSVTISDNVAVSGFIASWNNTGGWVNGTWTSGGAGSLAGTHNSTVGAKVSVIFYSNDTSNNWGTSSTATFTLTDGTVPSFTSITSSSTLAGSSTSLSVNITDNVAVSFLIWSTNINGTWINGTTTAFTSNPVTKALVLPSGIGTAFYVKVYANDTANNWAVSVQANFTTTAVYVSLQARDKDGLNLPRAVTFSGTLPNGTAYSVTSSAAGLYSLQCSNGSLTVAVTWQTHLVKTSTTIAVSANASSNLNTNIARLNYTSSQYVLVSINGTTLNTPSYTVLNGWKIDNINGTGQKPLVVDQANWVSTGNPLAVKVGGNSYDRTNWVYASNILNSMNIDFVAYNEPTVELIYEVSSGDTDGSSGSSDSTPTTVPSNSNPLGANDFQISDVSLGVIQPNSTVTATLTLRYSGSSYTYQNIVLSEPFNSWLIRDSLSLRSYILSNPTESSVDVTLTFMIPAGISVQAYSGEISFTALDAFGASHTSTAVISASVEGASVKVDVANWVRGNLWIVVIAVVAVLAVLGFIAAKTRRR